MKPIKLSSKYIWSKFLRYKKKCTIFSLGVVVVGPEDSCGSTGTGLPAGVVFELGVAITDLYQQCYIHTHLGGVILYFVNTCFLSFLFASLRLILSQIICLHCIIVGLLEASQCSCDSAFSHYASQFLGFSTNHLSSLISRALADFISTATRKSGSGLWTRLSFNICSKMKSGQRYGTQAQFEGRESRCVKTAGIGTQILLHIRNLHVHYSHEIWFFKVDVLCEL